MKVFVGLVTQHFVAQIDGIRVIFLRSSCTLCNRLERRDLLSGEAFVAALAPLP